jgi:hypothetical protein
MKDERWRDEERKPRRTGVAGGSNRLKAGDARRWGSEGEAAGDVVVVAAVAEEEREIARCGLRMGKQKLKPKLIA